MTNALAAKVEAGVTKYTTDFKANITAFEKDWFTMVKDVRRFFGF